jgi:hypothetical protein
MSREVELPHPAAAGGKTDILVDWKGKNVFVPECKV